MRYIIYHPNRMKLDGLEIKPKKGTITWDYAIETFNRNHFIKGV